MRLTVLAVPGCPNAPVLNDRLAAVLHGRAGVSVSHQVISNEGEAARCGMQGSPTLLIDGVDPFGEPEQSPSMSCRLYLDENGQTSGAPSVGQLQQAIEQALAAANGPRDPTWLDSLGRAGRGRIAPAERGLRAVHGLLRVYELLRHPGSCVGVGSLPSGDHRRHPGPSPRPASRHRHIRPATQLVHPWVSNLPPRPQRKTPTPADGRP